MDRQAEQHWRLLSRVQQYTLITTLCGKAQSVYTTAKSSNRVVKLGLETVEGNLKKLSQPVITKLNKYEPQLDQFGCKQLDRLESACGSGKQLIETKIVTPVKGTLQAGKRAIDERVVQPIGRAKSAVGERVVKPAGTAVHFGLETVHNVWHAEWTLANLQTSFAEPLDKVLSASDNFVEHYLPPLAANGKASANGSLDSVNKPAAAPSTKRSDGLSQSQVVHKPQGRVRRARNIGDKAARRLWERASRKLRGMSLRSREAVASFAPYTVDLIHYAKTVIDVEDPNGVVGRYTKATKNIVASSVDAVKTVVRVTVDWSIVSGRKGKTNRNNGGRAETSARIQRGGEESGDSGMGVRVAEDEEEEEEERPEAPATRKQAQEVPSGKSTPASAPVRLAGSGVSPYEYYPQAGISEQGKTRSGPTEH